MALCPQCQKDISMAAKICPYCNTAVEGTKEWEGAQKLQIWIVIGGLVLFLYIFRGMIF